MGGNGWKWVENRVELYKRGVRGGQLESEMSVGLFMLIVFLFCMWMRQFGFLLVVYLLCFWMKQLGWFGLEDEEFHIVHVV